MTVSPGSEPSTATHRLTLRTGHSIHLQQAHVFGEEERGGEDQLGQGQGAQLSPSPLRDAGRCCVLVLVHGGPGLEESHKQVLAAFASPHQGATASLAHRLRRTFPGGVILLGYDQLGCGESDKPDSAAAYSLSAYVEELADVLTWAAAEERDWGNRSPPLFVLGHSFGGQVVLELLMSGGVEAVGLLHGAVVSNSPLDETAYAQRHQVHRAGLPSDLREFIARDEEEALGNGSIGSLVYRTLVGESESEVTGSMRGWSAINRLPEGLAARDGRPPPSCLLVVAGADPTESPEEARMPCVQACDGVEVAVIEEADHFPFYSTAVAYFDAIASFMERQLG